MTDWSNLNLTAKSRKILETVLDASRGDYQKTMQGLDEYADTLASELFDFDHPDKSLALTDPDSIIDAARNLVEVAQEAADNRYGVQRQAWQQAAGREFPEYALPDREDWTRVMWDVQKGFANTDYNGLTYRQVMAGKARSGVTIMDLLPKTAGMSIDDMQQAYADFFRSMAVHAAQRRQMANIANDPTRPRWARVPRGSVTCAFCTMLAGRGFVYTSEEAAGGGLGNLYHNHCDCEPVPSWGEAKLSGYDPDRLDAIYQQAKAQTPKGSGYRDILAKMRSDGKVSDKITDKTERKFGDDWNGDVVAPTESELAMLARHVDGEYTAKRKASALKAWTGTYSRNLQDWLYGGGGKLDLGYSTTVDELDEALTDNMTSKAFTVDRYGDARLFGVSTPAGVDSLRCGVLTEPNAGYLATSLDVGGHGSGVNPGDGVRIRILLPPGTHCAYLQDVTQVKDEHEILLPRNVKLRVVDHGVDDNRERWVHAVLVSDGTPE